MRTVSPHQKIRKQVLKRLDITRAHTEVNYNKDFKVPQFAVGDCVGVKVDRADRGAVDRAYIPCLIVDINGRGQHKLRCESGVLATRFIAAHMQSFPKICDLPFTAEDSQRVGQW